MVGRTGWRPGSQERAFLYVSSLLGLEAPLGFGTCKREGSASVTDMNRDTLVRPGLWGRVSTEPSSRCGDT